jgi:predicted secreted protein
MRCLYLSNLLALILSLLISFASTASAGDYAKQHIFGFSPDGNTFAFEQFGVQDGSGFPYADIFVIDTSSDKWIKGSPFEVLMRDERANVKWARREALTKAGNVLRQHLVTKPGRLLSSNTPEEFYADPHKVIVNTNGVVLSAPERWIFTLEEFPITNRQCATYIGAPAKGFRLMAQKEGGEPLKLHEDTSIPKSRGCPLRYAISDVVAYEPVGGARVIAVLVSIFAHGFEGPNRRFLAVTKRFK